MKKKKQTDPVKVAIKLKELGWKDILNYPAEGRRILVYSNRGTQRLVFLNNPATFPMGIDMTYRENKDPSTLKRGYYPCFRSESSGEFELAAEYLAYAADNPRQQTYKPYCWRYEIEGENENER